LSIEADIETSDMGQWPEKLWKLKAEAMMRLKLAKLRRGEGTRKWPGKKKPVEDEDEPVSER